LIERGFEAAYRRGGEALACVRKDPSPENYHELRKRVKDHWYHMRLLEDAWPEVLHPYVQTLNDLQEWLGEDHNLAVLRETLAHAGAGQLQAEQIDSLARLIGNYQTELRERSIAAAERIYTARPKALTRRTRHLWEVWQKHPTPTRAAGGNPPRVTAFPVKVRAK
jgi:CHAD domain-containing protein